MSERIRELAEQANLEIDPAYPDHNQKVLEKFAELIVRECAKIAEKEQTFNDSHEIHVNIDQCILIEFGF